ncbi:CIC11C00000005453 [Sungouiella intermedia]|uniref:CIC11C00000005453 n=1 Tax=Sungouiella intermedia TaxID=45354 RepID=A0A1L0D819_9ASCO|nr:CIC11C00000005453 [[Candida] intermedia]
MEVTPITLHGANSEASHDSPPHDSPELKNSAQVVVDLTVEEKEAEVSKSTKVEIEDATPGNDSEVTKDEEDDYQPFVPSEASQGEESTSAEASQHRSELADPADTQDTQDTQDSHEAADISELASSSKEQLTQETSAQNDESNSGDEDEYDPETAREEGENNLPTLPPPPPPHPQEDAFSDSHAARLPSISVKSIGLPPKPPTLQPQDSATKFKEAYEAIMQSDIVKDPLFTSMSQQEQMDTIQRLLQERNISLPLQSSPSIDPDMNFDQVYSYNKPFKNIKDPIPLVPVGKYCRRPNITRPMNPAERAAYEDFLATEARHSGWGQLDDLPENLRLFVGNLPANTITKEDLFRIFSQYGEVLQISIKAGYGFIQYRTAEACAESIKGETNVPLHNKYMRLAASKSQKNRATGSRGRERSGDEYSGEHDSKRRRTNDVQLLRNEETSQIYFSEVEDALRRGNVSYTTINTTIQSVSDEVREAAYLGVIGACVVKDSKIDLQTFEETPDGGIKFDEYVNVDIATVLEVVNKVKASKPLAPPSREFNSYDDRRSLNRRGDSYQGSAYSSRGDRSYGDSRGFGRNQTWQRGDREWSQPSRPPRGQWSRNDGQGYNEPPYHRQNHGNQYGGPLNYNQDYGRGYNQGYNGGYDLQMPPGPPGPPGPQDLRDPNKDTHPIWDSLNKDTKATTMAHLHHKTFHNRGSICPNRRPIQLFSRHFRT